MKEDTKQKLIKAGAEIMHLKGFNNTGLKEVLDRTGIPKGSFYNFFRSKEDFGLQIIDYYVGLFLDIFAQFLSDQKHPPLERIRLLFAWLMAYFKSADYTLGCPLGNFAQEMGDINPAFQAKLKSAFDAMADLFAAVLREARRSKALPGTLDVRETSRFIVSSWEGAVMLMKVTKSTEPLEAHARFIFEYIFKKK